MSPIDDDGNEMGAADLLSDDVIEAFIAGEAHAGWAQDDALVAVDRALAEILARPAPAVGHELASFVRATPHAAVPGAAVQSWAPQAGWAPTIRPVAPLNTPSTSQATRSGRSRRRILAVVAGGAAIAATALPVAAAIHVLPEPARQVVATVLEAVTPFDFDSSPAPTTFSPPPSAPSTTTPPAVPAADGPAPSETSPASLQSGHPAPAGVPAAGSGSVPATTPPGVTPGPPAGITPGPPVNSDGAGSAGRAVAGQTPAATTPASEAGPPRTAGPAAALGVDRAGQAVGGSPAAAAAPGGAPPAAGPPFAR